MSDVVAKRYSHRQKYESYHEFPRIYVAVCNICCAREIWRYANRILSIGKGDFGGPSAVGVTPEIIVGFDASGRRADWWSAQSRANFSRRISALKDQYDAYEAMPGMHVDGSLTLGENIADLGGLEAA